jgi:hypothetical protein
MSLEEIARVASLLTAASGFLIGAVSAAFSWLEKGKDLQRSITERRQTEIRRMKAEFEKQSQVFFGVFDYASDADTHLRLTNLGFSPDEARTRIQVDQAFEFLRDMHTSVRLGLIKKTDIAPWAYWIHRVETRDVLQRYARACGYYAFLSELIAWTAASSELRELEEHCPWWKKGRDMEEKRGRRS